MSVAILIPCYNEEAAIADVVHSLKKQLPDAAIYVFDNNSTDKTAAEAGRAGAVVRHESRQGKGHVIRAMFREIEADAYVMINGNGTYPAERVRDLVAPILEGTADMVIGSRLHPLSGSRFKRLNWIGNKAFLFVLNTVFKMESPTCSPDTVRSAGRWSRAFRS